MLIIKKVLHVRMWLLIMGITPFIGSLPDLLDIENAVQNAWNAPLTERAMDIASAYEIIWTTHAMLFGAICIAVSFFLSSARLLLLYQVPMAAASKPTNISPRSQLPI